MSKRRWQYAWLLWIFSWAVVPAGAEEVTVAVASNFAAPMKKLVKTFEAQTDHQVRTVYGASGKFVAQIRQGAPFELFLSADQTKPEHLSTMGLVVADSQVTYGIGQLALWSANAGVNVQDGEILKCGDFTKLAIANPRLAPYGEAAMATLSNLGVSPDSDQLVQGENIAQTFHFVRSGNVKLGLVAYSQLMARDHGGSVWVVPADFYPPIKQDMVLLKRGEQNPAAKALWQFLQSAEAKNMIQRYGYRLAKDD